MLIKKLLFLPAILIYGCATTPEQLSRRSDLDICQSYGVFRGGIFSAAAPAYYDEMTRRNLLKDNEIDLVQNKQIRNGMSLCGLYASWGRPDKENRTVFRGGTRIQHVFNAGYRYIKPTYVYTDNGVISAWQD